MDKEFLKEHKKYLAGTRDQRKEIDRQVNEKWFDIKDVLSIDDHDRCLEAYSEAIDKYENCTGDLEEAKVFVLLEQQSLMNSMFHLAEDIVRAKGYGNLANVISALKKT